MKYKQFTRKHVDRDSSVGIASRYGLGCPGIESQWWRDFSAPVQTGPEAHPASYTMSTGALQGVKQLGRGVDPPSHLAPVLKKVYINAFSPPQGLHGLF